MSLNGYRTERERIAKQMQRGEVHDPIDSLNFRACLAGLFNDEWDELADAFHSGDLCEFGALLANHAKSHAYREATCA